MNSPILHENLSLIEVADRLILDDLYADPRTEQFLLTRLGPTIAVVAPGAGFRSTNRDQRPGIQPTCLGGAAQL